jgi:serine/threonine protein kinase
MRPFGTVTKEDIKKEVDAVIAICKTGGHDNIIKIYGQGTIPLHDYYYVDMEFCDMNLEDYIHSCEYDFEGTPNSSLKEQRKKWIIMTQITRGLSFLHKGHYVHRDLKPRNSNAWISLLTILVLFNQETKLWKLTDFGIMCQATSKNMITTENGRGTQGYRAPELMSSVTPGSRTKWIFGHSAVSSTN